MEFTIEEGWATPPYRTGKIGVGRWHVLLGPYKVGPRGCDWRVEVWFDPGIPAPVRGDSFARRADPDPLPDPREGWLRGDLHCHSVYSDGDSWPREMLAAASEAGLDFLGVTDHNNVAHQPAYGPGGDGLPVVVPGIEVTTYGGHWNAWGTDRWWEFRKPDAKVVERAVRAAVDAGALVSVCHPKPFGPPWEYEGVSGFHAVEAWNSDWTKLNSASLAFWEERLRRGERVVLVGGSDTHYLRRRDPGPRHSQKLGTPTTWVRADPKVDAILAALRMGHAFVSESPRGPQLYLETDPGRAGRVRVEVRDGHGATLRILSDAGSVASAPVAGAEWDDTFAVPASARYVRAQLVGLTGEVRALSNPVWADRL
jgi:predicted metal-dependent phosphoesterase TrpH